MTDLASTIIPKSDQMNADDLISGPRTIKITKVSADTGSAEQPILIFFEGDSGKPYKPCKSMRRVMVTIWGSDGAKYPGRAMTLYRDPSVKWGGLEVGGIRISHMSDMDAPVTMALTATKQSRKPFRVLPLAAETKTDEKKKTSPIDDYAIELGDKLKTANFTQLSEWWSETESRRVELNIPTDRLTKMDSAVADALKKLSAS